MKNKQTYRTTPFHFSPSHFSPSHFSLFTISLLALSLFTLSIASCEKKGNTDPKPEPTKTVLSIVDKNASAATKALYANLWQTQKIAPMFGHHDYSAYGVGWRDIEGKSDVKTLCGDNPAVLSVDIAGIERDSAENGTKIPFEKLRVLIKECHARGGITMICWHQWNPVTGGNAWDNTKAVDKILTNGGEINIKYKVWLDNVARFMTSLKDDKGELIPVIFRPLHEHTQTWSWWGSSATTDQEFIDLWRMIVTYLRDTKQVHNILYAISPQMDGNYGTATLERLQFRWPGDNYVDFIGMDCYHGTNTTAFKSNLAALTQLSFRLKKPAGVTETGIPSGRSSDYWSTQIESPVKETYCSMVVMWRNESTSHGYGPYPGDASASDFINVHSRKSLLFEKDLPAMYTMPDNITIN
jgi:mannan endo-1,4-beta-mannosidase